MSQNSLRKEVEQLSNRNESPRLDNAIYQDDSESSEHHQQQQQQQQHAKADKILDSMQEAYFDANCSMFAICSIAVGAVLEAVSVGFWLCLPAGLAFLFSADPSYDLRKVKYGVKAASAAMNPTMEFVRFSLLAAMIYACLVLLNAAARVAPLLVRRSWHALKKPLPNSLKITLAGWRSCRPYVVAAALAICAIALFDTWVYAGTAMESLTAEMKAQAESIGFTSFGRSFERLLASLSMLALLVVFCQWLMHCVTQEYRKAALAKRINESNKKYHVIAQLVRLTALGSIDARRSLKQERLRSQLHPARDELIKLTPDTAGLHLRDEQAARVLARRLWDAVCPFGRDYIVAEDLGAFFSDPVEAKESFRVFDEAEIGLVNAAAFETAVVAFQRQRANLQASVQMSDKTLGILSHGMTGLILFIWISTVVWLYNQKTVSVLLSSGTLLITCSFLFKDIAKRVFGCFVFILVVHPYDIGDTIFVDKKSYKVVSIGLFSTTLRRDSDGTHAHYPNSALLSKSIFNRDRSSILADSMMVSLPASTSLGQIGALQRKLKAYLEAQFESFTGSVAIVPADGFEHAQQQGGDQMSVRVECLYAETGQVEPEARVIRKEHVSAKLAEFLQVL